MRMSIRKSDIGYDPEGYKYEAYLNGKKIDHCFTADEELGIAYLYDIDKEGNAQRDWSDSIGGSLKEKEVYGKVEIKKRVSYDKNKL